MLITPTQPTKLEYAVRPVTRYIVTRYHEHRASPDASITGAGCSQIGEYASEKAAYDVAYACCKLEHQTLGYALDDPRIQYPRQIEDGATPL